MANTTTSNPAAALLAWKKSFRSCTAFLVNRATAASRAATIAAPWLCGRAHKHAADNSRKPERRASRRRPMVASLR
jgi:hypothetical protein